MKWPRLISRVSPNKNRLPSSMQTVRGKCIIIHRSRFPASLFLLTLSAIIIPDQRGDPPHTLTVFLPLSVLPGREFLFQLHQTRAGHGHE